MAKLPETLPNPFIHGKTIMSETAEQPVFSIEKLYVKDLSLEVPNAPQIYLEREAPQISVQLRTEGNAVDEGVFEVKLTVTVTAKLGEEKTVFLVEVAQAGIFQIRNVPQEDLEPIMMIGCANILFPYAREAVSDAVARAGFQPVILAPVNFEALFQQNRQQASQEPAADTPIQ
jgi:preprotein translocase subunit SecB